MCQVLVIQLVKEEIKMSEKLNVSGGGVLGGLVVVFFFLTNVVNVKRLTIGRASKQTL